MSKQTIVPKSSPSSPRSRRYQFHSAFKAGLLTSCFVACLEALVYILPISWVTSWPWYGGNLTLLWPIGLAMSFGFICHTIYQWRESVLSSIQRISSSLQNVFPSSKPPKGQHQPDLTNESQADDSFKVNSSQESKTLDYLVLSGKRMIAGLTPRWGLIRLARNFPEVGGLFEHSDYLSPHRLDDLFISLKIEQYDQSLEIIKLAPQDSLDRMLSRKDLEGQTPMFHAISNLRVDVFEAMFLKLAPEQRMKHLLTTNCLEPFIGPSILYVIRHYQIERMQKIWSIIMQNLSPNNLAVLLSAHEPNGDSIWHEPRVFLNIIKTESMRNLFSEKEVIEHITEVCPHSNSFIITFFRLFQKSAIEEVMNILGESTWNEIFKYKPDGWTMTVGEKALIAAYMSDREFKSDDTKNKLVPMLEKTYHLELPETFKSLKSENPDEFHQLLERMAKLRVSCLTRQRFVDQWGETPEAILQQEVFLPMRNYTQAWKRLQRQHHPDKCHTEEAHQKSILLNKAHAFLTDEKECHSYIQKQNIIVRF